MQMKPRDQASADARHAWADLNAALIREAMPRPSLARRVLRSLAPVLGPLCVLIAPPLALVALVIVHR